jgi:hypothetical protein
VPNAFDDCFIDLQMVIGVKGLDNKVDMERYV